MNKFMKANEAPKNLYLSSTGKLKDGISTGRFRDTDIEYTRTDAFIEKALVFIRSCTTYDGLGYKAKCVNIEDFKNYMERE